jgi:hypothetical protein
MDPKEDVTSKKCMPVKANAFITDKEGVEHLIYSKLIMAEEEYFFNAKKVQTQVQCAVIDLIRVELTLVFPAKEEIG